MSTISRKFDVMSLSSRLLVTTHLCAMKPGLSSTPYPSLLISHSNLRFGSAINGRPSLQSMLLSSLPLPLLLGFIFAFQSAVLILRDLRSRPPARSSHGGEARGPTEPPERVLFLPVRGRPRIVAPATRFITRRALPSLPYCRRSYPSAAQDRKGRGQKRKEPPEEEEDDDDEDSDQGARRQARADGGGGALDRKVPCAPDPLPPAPDSRLGAGPWAAAARVRVRGAESGPARRGRRALSPARHRGRRSSSRTRRTSSPSSTTARRCVLLPRHPRSRPCPWTASRSPAALSPLAPVFCSSKGAAPRPFSPFDRPPLTVLTAVRHSSHSCETQPSQL